MNKVVKIVLGLVAVPVVVLVGAFGYGMFLGATGGLPGPDQPNEPASPAQGEGPGPQPALSKAPSTSQAPRANLPALPSPLDADSAQKWLLTCGLISLEGDNLVHSPQALAALDEPTASAVHHALRTGGKKSLTLRIYFFALCGELEPELRKAFAKEVGAIYRPSRGASSRGYIGDFTKLFWSQTEDANSHYARTVRAYCEVLTTKEIIQALTDFGVIDQRVDHDTWLTHVDREMQSFDQRHWTPSTTPSKAASF